MRTALLAFMLWGCTGPHHAEPSSDPQDTRAVEPDPPPDTAPPVVLPSLVIGTGETTWVGLETAADVVSVRGPQGGFHLLGSLRGTGFAAGGVPGDVYHPDNPLVDFIILRGWVDADDLAGLNPTWPVAGKPQPAIWKDILGGYVDLRRPMGSINPDADPELIGDYLIFFATSYEDTIDQQVTLFCRLETPDGHVITAHQHVWVVPEPAWSPSPPDTSTPTETGIHDTSMTHVKESPHL